MNQRCGTKPVGWVRHRDTQDKRRMDHAITFSRRGVLSEPINTILE